MLQFVFVILLVIAVINVVIVAVFVTSASSSFVDRTTITFAVVITVISCAVDCYVVSFHRFF